MLIAKRYLPAVAMLSLITIQRKRPPNSRTRETCNHYRIVWNELRLLIPRVQSPGAAGETVNIACGTRVTLNELVKLIGKLVGSEVEPLYETSRTGDVKHSLADIGKAQRLLGYEPKIGLEEGLRRTVDWLRTQGA